MDAFARALVIADRLIRDKALSGPMKQRYAGYRTGMGRKIRRGTTDLIALEKWATRQSEPPATSGRQEALENILNEYIFGERGR
jgi:xylose isomerase